MKPLPKFKPRPHDVVTALIHVVLAHPQKSDENFVCNLLDYPDGHYRVLFDLRYFQGSGTPTKSQWNGLKKKLKRHDRQIFVFKECGIIPCTPDGSALCGYVDFGFFAQ